MPKKSNVISIDRRPPTGLVGVSDSQPFQSRRERTRSVLRRLRADQNLAKIRWSEDLTWEVLTEIVCEFIDWPNAHAYIRGNLKVA